MRVEKFNQDEIAALRAAGFEIAEDNESAEAHCHVSVIKPDGSEKLQLEIRFANEAWKLVYIFRDDLAVQYEDDDEEEDDNDDDDDADLA